MAKFYLCGAIEKAPDYGRTWREQICKWLDKKGHTYYNPCEEESDIFEKYELDGPEDLGLLKAEDIENHDAVIHELADKDYEALLECDAIICLFDEYANKGAGTAGEVSIMHLALKKPVYTINKMGSDIPSWIRGCSNKIFKSIRAFQNWYSKYDK